MKKLFLPLAFLGLVAQPITLSSQSIVGEEVPCDLPDGWRCGSRMADVIDRWQPHLGVFETHKECISSVQTNACNTKKQEKPKGYTVPR